MSVVDCDRKGWCEQSDKDEITIRRTITLQSDLYSMDGQKKTRQEIANILETAGFSKSNPYYIVEQGKVNSITVMKDAQRLALIKEVAGTKVYEEKKGEAEKLEKKWLRDMDETNKTMKMYEERLEKLGRDKEELSQYYALDKERRSIHHALLSKRVQILRDKLKELHRKEQELKTGSGWGAQEQTFEAEEEVLKISIHKMCEALKRIDDDKQLLDKEEMQLTRLECQHKDSITVLRRELERNQEEIKATEMALTEHQKAVKELKTMLVEIEHQIKQKNGVQGKTTEEVYALNRELEPLKILSEQSDYANQAERDERLNAEIKKLAQAKDEFESIIKETQQQVTATNDKKVECEERAAELEIALASIDKTKSHREAKKIKLLQEQFELAKKIKHAQRSKNHCETQRKELQQEIEGLEKMIERGMPNGCARALRFLDDYCKREDITGYHGPLLDLIHCNERYYNAVEQAGGAIWFHAVVDDDAVATKLVSAITDSKEGRLSIMPLSKLRPHTTRFPNDMRDATPLVSVIKCEDKFRVAVEAALGQVLLCSTLEVANKYRQSLDVDCVTIDGDRVARTGAIKGGYHDSASSKLKLNQQKQEKRDKDNDLSLTEAAATKELDELVQRQVAIETEQRHLDNDEESDERGKSSIARDLRSLKVDAGTLLDDIAAKEKLIEDRTSERTETQHKIDVLRDQLTQPFSTDMTDAQRFRLRDLLGRQTELLNRQKREEWEKSYLEKEKRSKNDELRDVLTKVEAIQSNLREMKDTRKEAALEIEEQKLKEVEESQKDCEENIKAKEEQLDDTKLRLQQQKSELEKIQTKIDGIRQSMRNSKNVLINIAADRKAWQKDIEVANRQLMELGSRPEAFENYKDKPEQNLKSSLEQVMRKLGKFKTVNKKAMDQFNDFKTLKEKLQGRMQEAQRELASIPKLIQFFDGKKEAKMQTTFKMVQRHFSDIFKTIVPDGEGKLKLQTDMVDCDGDESGPSLADAVREYIGIGIEVRFAAGDTVHNMNELSGGQKCVVSLCIIFAIQRCDPAPFYLFDEVDANLDPMYRRAVADMISKQAASGNGCQFVTSSFNDELVKGADVHWIVSHRGMSRITKGTRQDQLKIVRMNQQHM